MGEFVRKAFRQKFCASVDEFQGDLDRWLKFYNEERPHQGYRNMGKRSIDTVREFINVSRKKATRTQVSS